MTTVRKRTPMVAAMMTATLVLAPAFSFAQANRLIINRGASQQAAVSLTPDSTVSIDAVTGNVVVDCAASASNSTQCVDALGAGNPPPAFTLAASGFSQAQVDGSYPALTTFSLAPVGLDASYEACLRISTGGGLTNWNGVLPAAAASSSTVVMPNPSASYNFSLRCFSATGARTSNVLTMLTASGPPPVEGCPSNWNDQPWSSFSRSSERRFPDVRAQNGGFSGEFPRLGGLVVFASNVREYVSVQFTASDPQNFADMLKNFNWIEAQGGGAGSAQVNGVYFTISRCPGDFRLPAADNTPDPNEPTRNLGCRNVKLFGTERYITSGITYSLNDSPNNNTCALAQGGTYYLNFMTVNPLDGFQPNEHNCLDTTISRCGVAFQSQ